MSLCQKRKRHIICRGGLTWCFLYLNKFHPQPRFNSLGVSNNLYLKVRSGDVWPVSECRTAGMSTEWIDNHVTLPGDGYSRMARVGIAATYCRFWWPAFRPVGIKASSLTLATDAARRPGLNVVLCGDRLFQRYVVDACAKMEQQRLNYLRFNQNSLKLTLSGEWRR